MTDCISDVRRWMISDNLMLNDDLCYLPAGRSKKDEERCIKEQIYFELLYFSCI